MRTLASPLLLLALACGGPAATGTTPEAPARVEALEVPAARAVIPPEVRLLEPGGAPREALRVRPTRGLRQTIELAMDMDMRMQVGALPAQRVNLPTTTTTMHQVVTDVAESGAFRQEFGVDAIDVAGDGPMRAGLLEALTPLTTMEGWIVGDARGRVLGLDFTVAEDAPDATRQSMASMRDAMRGDRRWR